MLRDDAVSQDTVEPTLLHRVFIHLAYLAYMHDLPMIESLLVRYNSIALSAYCLWVRPWRGAVIDECDIKYHWLWPEEEYPGVMISSLFFIAL